MAQLRQRAHLDQRAVAQDAHAVAQRLDLAQDVRRQKDRLAALPGLADAVAEGLLHERVEAGGGLVEERAGRAAS